MALWFVSIAASTAVVGLITGGVMLVLGRRFIEEFTRPGVTVEQGTPQWGGWTFPEVMGEPPTALQRAVTFPSADGALLRGEFWAQTRSAPTIIISHGFHLPCVYFRSVAALEYAHGANILLFDYRGHGQSALLPTTCGNAEINDLMAAVDVAASQSETRHGQVYIHGFSMGAAVALLLPPHAAVAGVIADSSYARLDEMVRVIITQILDQETAGWHGPARATRILIPSLTRLTFLGGQLLFHARYRSRLVARPDRAIGDHRAKGTLHATDTTPPPILLIHAEDDPMVALHHARRLVAAAHAAGRSIQEYYTPCAIHCGSYGHDPHRYMALILQFAAL
ncbi:MAG TPA: alpha/beta fold hydrolase [Ktedonobacteraceae bacterium]|nr:alpha/beta fold hydrolase [Ktedonobacteraceae bacterium]